MKTMSADFVDDVRTKSSALQASLLDYTTARELAGDTTIPDAAQKAETVIKRATLTCVEFDLISLLQKQKGKGSDNIRAASRSTVACCRHAREGSFAEGSICQSMGSTDRKLSLGS